MFQDIRYALRVLLKNKGWTTMVVLSLALGIGGNTALFSAINGMLLRKLPVADPDTLVRLRYVGQNDMSTNRNDYGGGGRELDMVVRSTTSYPIYQQLLQANRTLTDMFACAPFGSLNIVINGGAEIASGFIATGNYHSLLGVRAVVGRTLTPNDDKAGVNRVAVLSYAYWRRRFGSDPRAVGRVVQVNNIPVTIVGVTSPEFTGVQRLLSDAPDISLPFSLDPELAVGPSAQQRMNQATSWWVQIMGRLKPGMTPDQVQGNLEGVFRAAARQGLDWYLASLSPEERTSSGNRNRTQIPQLRISSGARGMYDAPPEDFRTVVILTIVVALLLLIVCANIANLLLSRAAVRMKEISVRLSVGATRRRLVKQLLTESLLLACIGGTLGLVVAAWGKELLPAQTAQSPLDWRVLLFTSALTLATGIVFGIAPAMRATRHDVNSGLKEGSRTVVGSRTLLGKWLVVVQVAVSLPLLIGAGLFLRTVQNLRAVNVGFDPQNIVLFRVNARLNRYDPPRISALYQQMVEGLKTVPGIKTASFSSAPLLSGSEADTNLIRQGHTETPSSGNVIDQLTVSPDFFDTMGIPLIVGRNFTRRDDQDSPQVVLINQTAARKFFPNENPIGQRVGTSPEASSRFEIVGVVADAKYNSVRDSAPPTMYFAYFQRPVAATAFEVRTAGDPEQMIPKIRETIRQVDPNLPLMAITTQTEQINRRFANEWIFAQAYGLFGGIALLLTAIGLFGLMSYSVARRTNEVGIRMALGAQPLDVLRMIMRESLMMIILGLTFGLAVALAAVRFMETLLFDLSPVDPIRCGAALAVVY